MPYARLAMPATSKAALAHHVIAEMWGTHLAAEKDIGAWRSAAAGLAGVLRGRLLEDVAHDFGPGLGMTYLAVLSSSHVAIHTWPEFDYVAVDAFRCGRGGMVAAALVEEALRRIFRPRAMVVNVVERGVFSAG